MHDADDVPQKDKDGSEEQVGEAHAEDDDKEDEDDEDEVTSSAVRTANDFSRLHSTVKKGLRQVHGCGNLRQSNNFPFQRPGQLVCGGAHLRRHGLC